MTDDLVALTEFGGVARLFPLPNLVLFPQVVQKLHIFEPRYRQMTADALAGDTLITLVLLKPGWEGEYDDRPGIEPVGCLGRVIDHEKLPDGRYNLRLRGLARLRIGPELPSDKLYRVAEASLMADAVPPDFGRLIEHRRRLADAVLHRFGPDGSAHQHLRELFEGELPLGQLCDVLAYALPLPLDLKQRLLAEADVGLRADVLADALRLARPAASRTFPPEFSPN
ncbi:MAG: LON peptidase substrate-binding domain-containing protein [Gemmataceae bacterium]